MDINITCETFPIPSHSPDANRSELLSQLHANRKQIRIDAGSTWILSVGLTKPGAGTESRPDGVHPLPASWPVRQGGCPYAREFPRPEEKNPFLTFCHKRENITNITKINRRASESKVKGACLFSARRASERATSAQLSATPAFLYMQSTPEKRRL